MGHKILFVCLGNICRSPAAEAVLAHLWPEAAPDSAGTGGWHVGEPPHDGMRRAAAARGLRMDHLRARQFTAADFARFDLIVAMDARNQADIEALRPPGNTTPVRLFSEFAPPGAPQDVPDPYYTGDFDGCLDLIEAGARGLRDQIAG